MNHLFRKITQLLIWYANFNKMETTSHAKVEYKNEMKVTTICNLQNLRFYIKR